MEMFFIYLFQYSISGAKIQIIWFPIVKVSQKASLFSQIEEKKNTPRFGKILYFRAMKVDFQYSTDFLAMNAPELGHTCCVEVIIT